jgi:hypothetical protein
MDLKAIVCAHKGLRQPMEETMKFMYFRRAKCDGRNDANDANSFMSVERKDRRAGS